MRQQPESIYQGHPFYPQLNRVGSPGGSEIYRGGFRSPLRSTLEGSFVLEGSSGVLGSIRRPKSAGMHMVDSVLSLSAPLKQTVEAVLPTTTSSSSSIIHSLSESDTRNKILSDELDELGGGGSSAILDDDRDREDSNCLFIGESVTAETVTAEEEVGGYVSHKYHHRPTSRDGDYVGVKIVPKQPKRVLAHMDDTSVTSNE